MMHWGGGWDAGYWTMFLFSIVVIVAVVVGIVFLVRSMSGGGVSGGQQNPPASHAETPEELVRRRYAAGEIDREEYEQKLRDLRS